MVRGRLSHGAQQRVSGGTDTRSADPRSLLPAPPAYFVERLLVLEGHLREAVLGGRSTYADVEWESDVVRDAADAEDYSGDTIYRIDERGEAALLQFCDELARERDEPFVLVAEGLPGDGRRAFPAGASPEEGRFELIVDPIDGTRGLMYDKRSAWALAAVAPGQAALHRRPTLADLVVAAQMELPTTRARLADTLWAVVGKGAHGSTLDLATGQKRPWRARPSAAATLAHGFATVAKFFPGTKLAAVSLEERLFAAVVGEHAAGAPLVFDDEYISSGGQLYELMVGHDRFVADLRPAFMDAAEQAQKEITSIGHAAQARRLCARPYDLCTTPIALEAGVRVTSTWGAPLDAPLDTISDVAWVGYANAGLQTAIEPVLQRLLREMGVPERRG